MTNVKVRDAVGGVSTTENTTAQEGERLNTFSFLRRRHNRCGPAEPALCRPRATGHHQPDQCQRRTP